ELHGRGARAGFLPQARGLEARDAQGPRPGGAAGGRRRIAAVPDDLQRQRGLDQGEGRADRLGRGRAAGRAAAGDRGGGERAASARGAPVRRLRALARGAEAPRRYGPRALEPDAEDAARRAQTRHGRSDQIARRGVEVGADVERAGFEAGAGRNDTVGWAPEIRLDRIVSNSLGATVQNETGALIARPLGLTARALVSRSGRRRGRAWCRPCPSPR